MNYGLVNSCCWPVRVVALYQAGRLHRLHHAEREVIIYDYVDANIPIARRMFEKRKKGYAAMGYELENSKILAEIPLPDEPSLNL